MKRSWDWGVFGLRIRERDYAFSKWLDGCVMRSRLGFAFAEEELAQWSFVHRVRVNKNSAYEFIWDDFRFSVLDYEASEILLKAGSTETIEMPATELCQVGSTFIWDVTIVRGEVIYKEEFVLEEENSYTIILQKEKKLSSPIRNTFKNNEAGKVVLTIKNTSSKK
uniref:Patellin-4-like n=1 Tax=Nicotiana tabacum TaxID=4097 RepID=A0A1S3YJS0_TOBAC|nr:PREDICTED: patellin-4-like [Nicotiana tabacum]